MELDDWGDLHIPSPNAAAVTESDEPLMKSTGTLGKYHSYDSGVGLQEHNISPRLPRPSPPHDDENDIPMRGSELRQRANKPAFTCLLCSETVRRTYKALNILKRHISEQHHPQFEMSCPYGDWTGTSRERMRRHFKSAHSGQVLPARRELEVAYEAPASCALCGESVRSWDEFYNCLFKHCEIKGMGSKTKSIPEEQAELDVSNTLLPSDVPREMRKHPTNEPMVKTDGDLDCDELLNSYLDRSDFVSTFSLDIFRKSHPRGHDAKGAVGRLSDLHDILWSFAEKLIFKGSEPCRIFGWMVCRHSGYAFRTNACQIKY